MSLFDSLTTDALDTSIIGHFIPPYVSDGSWQPWDESSGEPCPVGFTCGALGNTSYGAFSCDECKCSLSCNGVYKCALII